MQQPIGDILQVEGPQSDPVEWWYWNGHLKSDDGREFAYMLALFKAGVFGLVDVYFTHWLVSDLQTKQTRVFKKTFWGGLDKGSFADGKLKAGAGKTLSVGKEAPDVYQIETPDFALRLVSKKTPLLAGGTGLVDLKSSTTVCYSLTRLETSGRLAQGHERLAVTGLSWMDHQWSPMTFSREHVWTWFCFQFSDGTDLVCFEHGRRAKSKLATVSRPDGRLEVTDKVEFFPVGEKWRSPATGREYATDWTIRIPDFGIGLDSRAPIREQEMKHAWFRYWEGPVQAEATINGQRVEGKGFLEMNGV